MYSQIKMFEKYMILIHTTFLVLTFCPRSLWRFNQESLDGESFKGSWFYEFSISKDSLYVRLFGFEMTTNWK